MASNNSSASSLLDPLGRNKVQIGFEVFFAGVICLVSILGNFLVVFVINKDSQLKTITNIFIHNLACTDICMAATVMPFWIINLYNGRWIFGTELCQWTSTMVFTCMSASVWTMGLIALNRYLKVVKPNLYAKFFPSIQMARVYCVSVWLLAVLLSSPPLYGWGQYIYDEFAVVCGLFWEIENPFGIVFVGIHFGGVQSVNLFCYYKIYRTVKVSSTNLNFHAAENNVPNVSQNNTSQTTDIKLLKATFTVLCAFCVCYAPASVVYLRVAIFGTSTRPLCTTTIYLVFCSSGINPFVYGLMNPQLKRAFKKVLRCNKSEQENQANYTVSAQGSGITPATQQIVTTHGLEGST